MEKKDFKKGQKAILLSLKNVDFRKTMDIDAATEECTVVKVGRKYITVEDSLTRRVMLQRYSLSFITPQTLTILLQRKQKMDFIT